MLEVLKVEITFDTSDIDSIWHGMVEKPYVSAFQNFLRIENWLNIKKVMSKNMCMFFQHLWHA